MGSGGTNALMFSMQADTVDYGEWKTGTRAEGGSYSILSFVRKCGQGLGGAVGGAVVGAFGYAELAAAAKKAGPAFGQTASDLDLLHAAQPGIAIATGWLPAALGVIAAIIIFFYPLSPAQHRDVVADLTQRRAKRAAEEAGLPVNAAGAWTTDRPVVTISEQYGAGGEYVATKLAERLGVPFTGYRFGSEQLEELEAAEQARSDADEGVNRFLQSMSHTMMSDADASFSANAESDHDLVLTNTTEVLEAVRDGGVIVGRDANRILAESGSALNVRLVGTPADRIQRAMDDSRIDRARATERQEREDRMRSAMSRRLMKYDPDDAPNYDLVVNTSSGGLDEAVETILDAYHRRHRG